jgi:nucleoside transporter
MASLQHDVSATTRYDHPKFNSRGRNMTMTAVADDRSQTPLGIRVKLSIMMFLQYAIWGAWLPLFFDFLTGYRKLAPEQAAMLFTVGATGALIAPFVAGQIADRWFNTEKFLAISHLVGAVLVWQLAVVSSYGGLLVLSLLYAIVYAPTLALTNSLAFHHLVDRDREFGKIRLWGTIGWIVVGIAIGQWLYYMRSTGSTPAEIDFSRVAGKADSLKLSAILGIVMGLFCLILPKTPPRRDKQNFAAAEAIAEVMRSRALLVLFLVSFVIACVHQFYFVLTSGFLRETVEKSGAGAVATGINRIFGVGGGGLMTIGQISELVVLAIMPFIIKSIPRKVVLLVGVLAYTLRFAIFAYLPYPWAVIPGLALHGLCFGCFFFLAFIIVDELTTKDIRASAQSLFGLIVFGLGVVGGNYMSGKIGAMSKTATGLNYTVMFSIPMWISLGCLIFLALFYPSRAVRREEPLPSAFPVIPVTES